MFNFRIYLVVHYRNTINKLYFTEYSSQNEYYTVYIVVDLLCKTDCVCYLMLSAFTEATSFKIQNKI